MRIIQINGFRGLITALFIGLCLFAGFVVFPGACVMYGWNKYLTTLAGFPILQLYQGVLLWGIAVVAYFILNKKGLAVSFKEAPELSDSEMNMIMKNAKIYSKMRKINHVIAKSDKFEKSVDIIKPNEKDLSSVISKNIEEKEDSVSKLK